MKMLLALDPFGQSRKAFEEALTLTKLKSAELQIIMVAETFHDISGSGLPGGPERFVPFVQQKAAEAEAFALENGVKPKIFIEKAEVPIAEILRCAQVEKVDLIIMGHQDRHGLDLFVLGSVAMKVVKNAHCSVLVVR
jgi:nucleotide-binding universal stress UspA family protein